MEKHIWHQHTPSVACCRMNVYAMNKPKTDRYYKKLIQI